MNYDDFVSFMADYNQKLYPNHNNMWRKIHLLDNAKLNPKTIKTFQHFKSTLSKTLQYFSQTDIEKLLIIKNGPRPHPNTFILKKLGVSPKTYKTIRYAIFNHTRYAKGNNVDNLIPIVNKDNSQSKSNEIVPDQFESKTLPEGTSSVDNKDLEVQIQQLQSHIEEMRLQIADISSLKDYLISYLEQIVDEKVKGLKNHMKKIDKQIQDKISNEMNIQSQSIAEAFLGGAAGGSAVTLIEKIIEHFTAQPKEDIENRINWLSQRMDQMEQSIQENSKNIQQIVEYIKFITNITNGFNYLRLFGVPITKEDWDNLSEDLKQSWSPAHIKPPITNEARQAIAKSIKQKEFPTVKMCYDFG